MRDEEIGGTLGTPGGQVMMLDERLRRIVRTGTLTVIGSNGRRRSFGSGAPATTIRVCRPGIELALLLDGELAFPEAYMDGGLVLEEGDLRTVLQLLLANVRRQGSDRRFGLLSRLHELASGLIRRNPIGRARSNVVHHYDLSGELYALFLDSEREYSCAFFENDDEPLEAAQRAKERRIAAKLLLRPGHKVLDIGSGWGALTRHICESFDRRIHATGVTLSQEQLTWATARAVECGLADRLDY
ncbi:MAG: SAM-dependent methyltransferase [Geminicoccaceae bacterium]